MNKIVSLIPMVMILVCVSGTLALAQTDAEVAQEKIKGEWSVDLEKSREIMPEDDFSKLEREFERGAIKLTFGEEQKFALSMGEEMLRGDMTYTMEPLEGEDGKYTISVQGGPPMKATMSFVDDNTLKFAPDGEQAAILVREKKVFTAEEFEQLLEGEWLSVEDEGRGVTFKEGGKAVTKDGGHTDPESSFTVAEGDEANQFVVTFEFGSNTADFSAIAINENQFEMAPKGTDEKSVFKRVEK